jgi:hypothetical protein
MTSGYIYRKLGVSFTKQPAEGVSGALGRWISDQRPRLNPSTRASASADKRAREVTGSGARRADRPGPTVGAPVRGWIRSNLFKSGPPDIRWMPETPWQDEAGSPWLPAAALPDSVAELHRRRGRVHARGSGALGRASVGSGGGGTTPAQKHWRVAVRGEVARQRHSSTPASDCAHTRAENGKLGARGGWLPRERTLGPLNGGRDAMRPRVDGGGTLAARWRSSERGQREIEGEGAYRGASWVAGVGAKLIGATDTAVTRRRSRNKSETTTDGGGAPLVRV